LAWGVTRGQQGSEPTRSLALAGTRNDPSSHTAAVVAKHSRLTDIPDDAFPRAELGLPIVFHFQEQGDPPDTVLYPANDSQGKKRERMASPLILNRWLWRTASLSR
jgi:hypothetical protein